MWQSNTPLRLLIYVLGKEARARMFGDQVRTSTNCSFLQVPAVKRFFSPPAGFYRQTRHLKISIQSQCRCSSGSYHWAHFFPPGVWVRLETLFSWTAKPPTFKSLHIRFIIHHLQNHKIWERKLSWKTFSWEMSAINFILIFSQSLPLFQHSFNKKGEKI